VAPGAQTKTAKAGPQGGGQAKKQRKADQEVFLLFFGGGQRRQPALSCVETNENGLGRPLPNFRTFFARKISIAQTQRPHAILGPPKPLDGSFGRGNDPGFVLKREERKARAGRKKTAMPKVGQGKGDLMGFTAGGLFLSRAGGLPFGSSRRKAGGFHN